MRRMQNKFLPEWHIPRHQYTDNLTDPENIHIRMHHKHGFQNPKTYILRKYLQFD